MPRDVWLDDDEPGCLECGSLVFKASKVPGVCSECISEVSNPYSEDSYNFADSVSSYGDDLPWQENT